MGLVDLDVFKDISHIGQSICFFTIIGSRTTHTHYEEKSARERMICHECILSMPWLNVKNTRFALHNYDMDIFHFVSKNRSWTLIYTIFDT